MSAFITLNTFYLLTLLATAVYTYRQRKNVDDMHGMMIGMTLGMLAGLVTGTLYLLQTGNFLIGVILGSTVGLLFGLPLGRLGGHLGTVEGIIAGPMGGMMGAMLGQMVRPYNLDIFIPFLTIIFITTLSGLTYAIHCGVSCCGKPQKKKFPHHLVATAAFASILLLSTSTMLTFSLTETKEKTQEPQLPAYLQQLIKEETTEAVQKEGYQEVSIHITQSRYSPNVIIAKKNIPLKLHFTTDNTPSCAQDLVIPDYNIRQIITKPTIIELQPKKEGTYPFRCSMDMARGKIIIQ